MKTTLLLILAVTVLSACSKIEKSAEPQKTIITGQVLNFEAGSDQGFIEFIYEDILARQTKLVANIDSAGNFRFVPDLDYPTEFYLKYSALVTLFVMPGDSLHIDIDSDCWNSVSKTYAQEYAYYKPGGTCAEINTEILKYMALYLDSLNNWDYHDSIIRNSGPLGYLRLRKEMTKERELAVQDFNERNNTPGDFRKWAEMDIKYSEWDDLMRYCWLHPMYRNTQPTDYADSIPSEYFNFLTNWDPEDRSQLANRNYVAFLTEYWMHTTYFTLQKKWADLDKSDPESGKKVFAIRKEYVQKQKPGFLRDVMLAQMYYEQLESKQFEMVKNFYTEGEIGDKILAKRVKSKFDYEKQLYENPEFAAGSHLNKMNSENEFMQELVSKYPGKVLYIDFWAPWCSPCMGEMPYSAKIKGHFEDKDVVFVYLANRCEETAWKATIAEKKMEGEHYRLTDKQFAELSQVFEITGIPHYVLIDRKGKVANSKASRPSSGEILEKEIEKLLE